MRQIKDHKVSVLMPCFNEEKYISKIVTKVLSQKFVFELIIVNDGSVDGSSKILEKLQKKYKKIQLINLSQNQGKGSAINIGLKKVRGDIVIIQDSDLEYDPLDFKKLVAPIKMGLADVVYGTRFKSNEMYRVHLFWHKLGNNFLTFLSNIFTNLNLSDMETGYKAFKSSAIKSIEIEERRFGFEPEITAKLAKLNLVFYEVPISYYGRSYDQGKKITWKDGFSALRCILKYNLLNK